MNRPDLADEAERWLRFAREDVESAEKILASDAARPRHVCWLAQQAAEKAIKAALVRERIDFPFRHDLDALRNLLPLNWALHKALPDLAELTEWAVEARYPGDWPEATSDDARRAVAQARSVYDTIRGDMHSDDIS